MLSALVIVYNGSINDELVDSIECQSATVDKVILLMHRQVDSIVEVINSQFERIENFCIENVDSGFRQGTLGHTFAMNVVVNTYREKGYSKFIFTTSDCMIGFRFVQKHLELLDKCHLVTGKIKSGRHVEDYRLLEEGYRSFGFFAWNYDIEWDNINLLKKGKIAHKENFSINIEGINIIESSNEWLYARKELFNFKFVSDSTGYVETATLLLKLRSGKIGIISNEHAYAKKEEPIEVMCGRYDDVTDDMVKKILTKPFKIC